MKTFRLLFPVTLLALAVPAARAQDSRTAAEPTVAQATAAPVAAPATAARVAAPATAGAVVGPATAGPTVARAAVGVRAATPAPATAPAAPKFADTSHNRRLMVGGGAAMILGTVIAVWGAEFPGALIMLGGAVVGLYGLYKYLE